jgi:D-sedoheptulose 7-phosphate isomerase
VARKKLQDYIRTKLTEGAKTRMKLQSAAGKPLAAAIVAIRDALQSGGKLLIFGNGGSAADAQHLAAEFVGRFSRERKGLPAIALTTDSSVFTSLANDYGFDQIFARQIVALGRPGDVAVGITTSGNSANVLEGFKSAKAAGLRTILLGGGSGGQAKRLVDLALLAPSEVVWQIQECHTALIHVLCGAVEDLLAGEIEAGALERNMTF